MTDDGNNRDSVKFVKFSVLGKHNLINLIKGIGVPHNWRAIPGLTRFTGSQWVESWEWNEDRLRQMNDKDLLNLYAILRSREGGE